MLYRRKPVARDVVDAIKVGDCYLLTGDGLEVRKIEAADFELHYEVVKRDRSAKPRKPRKPKVVDPT